LRWALRVFPMPFSFERFPIFQDIRCLILPFSFFPVGVCYFGPGRRPTTVILGSPLFFFNLLYPFHGIPTSSRTPLPRSHLLPPHTNKFNFWTKPPPPLRLRRRLTRSSLLTVPPPPKQQCYPLFWSLHDSSPSFPPFSFIPLNLFLLNASLAPLPFFETTIPPGFSLHLLIFFSFFSSITSLLFGMYGCLVMQVFTLSESFLPPLSLHRPPPFACFCTDSPPPIQNSFCPSCRRPVFRYAARISSLFSKIPPTPYF